MRGSLHVDRRSVRFDSIVGFSSDCASGFGLSFFWYLIDELCAGSIPICCGRPMLVSFPLVSDRVLR